MSPGVSFRPGFRRGWRADSGARFSPPRRGGSPLRPDVPIRTYAVRGRRAAMKPACLVPMRRCLHAAGADGGAPARSRSDTPSATNARTCAHSNALRTSTPLVHDTDRASLEGEADAISDSRESCTFCFPIPVGYGRPASEASPPVDASRPLD